jgi:predicted ATP-grasp superfamily ATP-dependent carboligase
MSEDIKRDIERDIERVKAKHFDYMLRDAIQDDALIEELRAEIEQLRKVLAIEGLSCKVTADIARQRAEIARLTATRQEALSYLNELPPRVADARRALEEET